MIIVKADQLPRISLAERYSQEYSMEKREVPCAFTLGVFPSRGHARCSRKRSVTNSVITLGKFLIDQTRP